MGVNKVTRRATNAKSGQRCKGDVLLYLLDDEGQRIGRPEDQRANDAIVHSIGLGSLRDMTSSEKLVWLVAARQSKANVIRGAILSGLANAIVIDHSVADMLLEKQ